MNPRTARAALLAPLLLAGCRLYDSAALKVSLEAPHGTQVQVRLPVIPHAPRRVEAVRLILDGQELPGSFGVGLEVDIDVSALAEGPGHWLQGIAAYGAETVRSEPIVFTVDRTPPAISWSPPPGTVALVPDQVVRMTFSEVLSAQSRSRLTSAGAGWVEIVGSRVPAVTDLGDGRSFEIALGPDADLTEAFTLDVREVTDLAGNILNPVSATWTNPPLSISLVSDIPNGWIPPPVGTVSFDVTVTGGRTANLSLVAGSTLLAPAGPATHFVWDTSTLYQGAYDVVASAWRKGGRGVSSSLVLRVTRGPLSLSCGVDGLPFMPLSSLRAHDGVRCTASRWLDPGSLPTVRLLDGSGLPVPTTIEVDAPVDLHQDFVVRRATGAGLPGPATFDFSGLRDMVAAAATPPLLPVEWPAWMMPGVTLRYQAQTVLGSAPSSIACGGASPASYRIVAAGTEDPLWSYWLVTETWSEPPVTPQGTWETARLADGPPWTVSVQRPAAAVDAAGRVALAWTASGPAGSEIHSNLLPGVPVAPAVAADGPALALDPVTSRPLVAFRNAGDLVVMRFAGSAWVQEGGLPRSAGAPGLPALAVGPDGRPVLAWIENGAIEVRRLDPTGWASVGPAVLGPGGLAVASMSLAVTPAGEPVLAYETPVGGVPTVLVSRWNGAAWEPLGGALNSKAGWPAQGPSVAAGSSGRLFVALAESFDGPPSLGSTIPTVRSFDGSGWVLAGDGYPAAVECAGACHASLAVCPGDLPVLAWTPTVLGVEIFRPNGW